MPASRHTYSHLHRLPLLFPSRLTPLLCLALSSQAREHPAEKVRALRDTTVDLIKYENLKAYREHIMSEQFQADTIQLVKVDLPAIAASAAKRGSEGLAATTTAFKEEVDRYSSKLAAMVPSETEIKAVAENLRTSGGALLVELQAELRLGVDHVKSEGFSIEDAIARLKRVVAIVDKTVVAPLITPAVTADETTDETTTDERPLPVTGVAESTDEETDVMHDAVEEEAAEEEEEEEEEEE